MQALLGIHLRTLPELKFSRLFDIEILKAAQGEQFVAKMFSEYIQRKLFSKTYSNRVMLKRPLVIHCSMSWYF